MVSSVLHALSGPVGLLHPLVHLRSMLPRSPLLDHFLHHALECADAVSPLSVPGQRIVARKRIATETWVRLGARVNLGVAFEVVAAHETLVAMVTSELSIAEMGLHVRLDVLLSSKFLVAVLVLADPFVVGQIGAFDELCDVVQRDVGLLYRSAHPRFQIEV